MLDWPGRFSCVCDDASRSMLPPERQHVFSYVTFKILEVACTGQLPLLLRSRECSTDLHVLAQHPTGTAFCGRISGNNYTLAM